MSYKTNAKKWYRTLSDEQKESVFGPLVDPVSGGPLVVSESEIYEKYIQHIGRIGRIWKLPERNNDFV
jgi:hypothetical protein